MNDSERALLPTLANLDHYGSRPFAMKNSIFLSDLISAEALITAGAGYRDLNRRAANNFFWVVFDDTRLGESSFRTINWAAAGSPLRMVIGDFMFVGDVDNEFSIDYLGCPNLVPADIPGCDIRFKFTPKKEGFRQVIIQYNILFSDGSLFPVMHGLIGNSALGAVVTGVCPIPIKGPGPGEPSIVGTFVITGTNLQGAEIFTDGPLGLIGPTRVNAAGTRIERDYEIGCCAPQQGQSFHLFVVTPNGTRTIGNYITLTGQAGACGRWAN